MTNRALSASQGQPRSSMLSKFTKPIRLACGLMISHAAVPLTSRTAVGRPSTPLRINETKHHPSERRQARRSCNISPEEFVGLNFYREGLQPERRERGSETAAVASKCCSRHEALRCSGNDRNPEQRLIFNAKSDLTSFLSKHAAGSSEPSPTIVATTKIRLPGLKEIMRAT